MLVRGLGTLVATVALCAAAGAGVPACAQGDAGAPASSPVAASPAVEAIRFYQRWLSDTRHAHCRFAPSCSEYAAQAIARYGVVEGSARAADRLMRCNASAAAWYRSGPDGRLLDPVEGGAPTPVSPRVPQWLLPERTPDTPPLDPGLEPGRAARAREAAEFAIALERRGDAVRAATEFERAGTLVGTPAGDAWAYSRSGDAWLASARWPEAERAFLASGMLAATAAARGRALRAAAAGRFDAGAFGGCMRLLDGAAGGDSLFAGAEDRVAALSGLCALARGEWSYAANDFARAHGLAADAETRARIGRLEPFAARGPALAHRSPGVAGTLSAIVPGSGQFYCGRVEDGTRTLLVDAALVWTVVSLARAHHAPAAWVAAGFAWPFYRGNIRGAGESARDFNRAQRAALVQDAIEASAR